VKGRAQAHGLTAAAHLCRLRVTSLSLVSELARLLLPPLCTGLVRSGKPFLFLGHSMLFSRIVHSASSAERMRQVRYSVCFFRITK
jgi:hypothetical protein